MSRQGRGCLIKCTQSGDPDRLYGLLSAPSVHVRTKQKQKKRGPQTVSANVQTDLGPHHLQTRQGTLCHDAAYI